MVDQPLKTTIGRGDQALHLLINNAIEPIGDGRLELS
ncbi:MAG: hypothetical protein ACI8Y4_000305 [Candidatus Poriferisodalaceae bacterium]|jgi:hypothetical protein